LFSLRCNAADGQQDSRQKNGPTITKSFHS
jgi:hypothetical protein